MSAENDANLSPDMRALVTVLREIRDEGRRCADALERIAEGVAPDNSPSAGQAIVKIAYIMGGTK